MSSNDGGGDVCVVETSSSAHVENRYNVIAGEQRRSLLAGLAM